MKEMDPLNLKEVSLISRLVLFVEKPAQPDFGQFGCTGVGMQIKFLMW